MSCPALDLWLLFQRSCREATEDCPFRRSTTLKESSARLRLPPPLEKEAFDSLTISLPLDPAGIRNSLDQVLLAVEEEEQGREHVDRGHSEGHADLRLVDL